MKDRLDYIASLNNNGISLARIFENRGEVHRLIGNYRHAYADFSTASRLSRKTRDQNKFASAMIQLSKLHLHKGDFSKAETCLLKASEVCIKNQRKNDLAYCLQQRGKIREFTERHAKAFQFYNRALAIYTRLHDEEGKYSVLENIAGNLRLTKQYQKALNILVGVRKYYRRSADRAKLVRVLQLTGNIYRDSGRHNSAIQYLQTAYDIARQIRDAIATTYLTCDLGIICYETGSYIEAKEYFETSLALSVSHEIPYMKAVALLNLGDTCAMLREYAPAKMHLDEVLAMNLSVAGIKNEARRILKEMSLSMKEDLTERR